MTNTDEFRRRGLKARIRMLERQLILLVKKYIALQDRMSMIEEPDSFEYLDELDPQPEA